MGALAPPPKLGDRALPETDRGGPPWEGVGIALGLSGLVAVGVGAVATSPYTFVVGVGLGVGGLVLGSPSVRERLPGLRPGWLVLAQGYDLEIVREGSSWHVRGVVGDAHLSVRVEADGPDERTVADAVLSGVDVSVRLANDEDAPDDPRRRWIPSVIASGRDVGLLATLDVASRARLVEDLADGLEIADGHACSAWTGAHHSAETLRLGLIAGPVWTAGWLNRAGKHRVAHLAASIDQETDDAVLGSIVCALAAADPRHPRIAEVCEGLRTSTSAVARLIAGVVLGDRSLAFHNVGARTVPSPWLRWALRDLLRASERSVTQRALSAALELGSPDLLWELSEGGRLGVHDFVLLARRWPLLKSSTWDSESGRQFISGTVDMLRQAGLLQSGLDNVPACPVFVRRCVAEAVIRTRDAMMVAALVGLRDDSDAGVAKLVREAITRLGLTEDQLHSARAVEVDAMFDGFSSDDVVDEEDDEPTVERPSAGWVNANPYSWETGSGDGDEDGPPTTVGEFDEHAEEHALAPELVEAAHELGAALERPPTDEQAHPFEGRPDDPAGVAEIHSGLLPVVHEEEGWKAPDPDALGVELVYVAALVDELAYGAAYPMLMDDEVPDEQLGELGEPTAINQQTLSVEELPRADADADAEPAPVGSASGVKAKRRRGLLRRRGR
jgi:hypothetical protein